MIQCNRVTSNNTCATTSSKSSTIQKRPAVRRFTRIPPHKAMGDVSVHQCLFPKSQTSTSFKNKSHTVGYVNPAQNTDTCGSFGGLAHVQHALCMEKTYRHLRMLVYIRLGVPATLKNVVVRGSAERAPRCTPPALNLSPRYFLCSETSLRRLYSAMVEHCLTHVETLHGPNSQMLTDMPNGRRMHVYLWTDGRHCAMRVRPCI